MEERFQMRKCVRMEEKNRKRKYDFYAHQHPGCSSSDKAGYLCYLTAVTLSQRC